MLGRSWHGGGPPGSVGAEHHALGLLDLFGKGVDQLAILLRMSDRPPSQRRSLHAWPSCHAVWTLGPQAHPAAELALQISHSAPAKQKAADDIMLSGHRANNALQMKSSPSRTVELTSKGGANIHI